MKSDYRPFASVKWASVDFTIDEKNFDRSPQLDVLWSFFYLKELISENFVIK